MNVSSWKPQPVTLYDGRVVMSDSADWLHECEARSIIALPGTIARRARLRGRLDESGRISGGILQKRGLAAVERLERTIKQIWYAR
ncbi:hypothetical protein [Pseudomonas phage PPpW-3]|uniref:Uncharacterized protein n=1 Tax=Pseudomonas phage PPpW-3 TaxID=1279082 RepID=V5YSV9_9CAUD|nr:hypothetical protein X916_gp50 [Pseudomonas phage PPpW-3]BAO20650.1 hypothetical protein [Pseudomonas phage PPpW-3]